MSSSLLAPVRRLLGPRFDSLDIGRKFFIMFEGVPSEPASSNKEVEV
jgi:hypothetical protein